MRRRFLQRLKQTFLLLCALLLLIPDPSAEATWSFSFMPTREYGGAVYEARPKSDLSTVLLIGYDHENQGDITIEQHGYSNGGQADFLLLVVMDHEQKIIRRLQIDRDTMSPVKLIGKLGQNLGSRSLQICLAHAYGATQEVNNANTVWAVEHMLGIDAADDGAEIDWYMTMDISGISKLNDLLGGVTVPIEDDFSKLDPTMVQGTTMRLTGKQAEYFCRARTGVGDQTNKSRMVRQRTYISAAGDVLMQKINENVNFATDMLNGMGIIYDKSSTLDAGFGFTTDDGIGTPTGSTGGHYLMTDESLDGIVGLVAKAREYKVMDIETLPGTHSLGADGFIRFDLEENAAEEWALSTFYTPLQ